MRWEERSELERTLALNRYLNEQTAKQNANKAYETERANAITTLTPLVKNFAIELHRRADSAVNTDTAQILAAYAPAQSLLLQLLREQRREKSGRSY